VTKPIYDIWADFSLFLWVQVILFLSIYFILIISSSFHAFPEKWYQEPISPLINFCRKHVKGLCEKQNVILLMHADVNRLNK